MKFYQDKWFWVSVSIVILVSIGMTMLLMDVARDEQKRAQEYHRLDSINKQTNTVLTRTKYTRDSSLVVLNRLKPYRTLTDIMSFRDSVCSGLPHRIGQVIRIKPDSTPAVIEEVIIRGNRFEYSAKYLVRTKDQELQISPEIVY